MPARMTYRQIADDLADRIRAGEYAPGAKLPTLKELAELYDVSFSTIQRSVGLLVDRGVVRGEMGRGLYVPESE